MTSRGNILRRAAEKAPSFSASDRQKGPGKHKQGREITNKTRAITLELCAEAYDEWLCCSGWLSYDGGRLTACTDTLSLSSSLTLPQDPQITNISRKGKRKVQGVPQSQAAAHPRHEEEEETDKTKQAQIEQTYEKH